MVTCFSPLSPPSAFLHSPHQPVYTATKHGVIGFSRAIAVRCKMMMSTKRNLRCDPENSARVPTGRVLWGQLRRPYQRAVSSLRQHSSPALSGRRGQHGQVCQVQGRFEKQNQQVWSFTVSEMFGPCVKHHSHTIWLFLKVYNIRLLSFLNFKCK